MFFITVYSDPGCRCHCYYNEKPDDKRESSVTLCNEPVVVPVHEEDGPATVSPVTLYRDTGSGSTPLRKVDGPQTNDPLLLYITTKVWLDYIEKSRSM